MNAVPAPVDFGYRTALWRTRGSSALIGVRAAAVTLTLFASALAMSVAAMFFGDYPLTAGDIVNALTGHADAFTTMVVVEWRLPIALAAVLFGAVLGVGGAIFQSLTRNPLGSPDIVGFDVGTYTAVVLMVLVFGTQGYWSIAGAALVGGLATAAAVYLLAYRRGVQGFRLIVVGISIAAMLGAVNTYLITRADVRDAIQVGFWSAGSLSRVSWTSMVPSLLITALIVLACAALAPSLRDLELGDDAAATQGVRVGPSRLALLVVGVATTAMVTAAAGPIGFIALVAPQLARRLSRAPGVSMLPAAAMGAALLAAAHLLSQVLTVFFRPIPVGLLTVCVGGLYLIGLLIHESRIRAGGST